MEYFTIKIGIVTVLWEFDDLDEKRTAFYELGIKNDGKNYIYINNYSFLDNNLCIDYDYTETNTFKLSILDQTDDNIKINICGDILYMNIKQYNLLNKEIANLQEKLRLDTDISKNI